jgi:ABC-type phosphate transport system substrate-binding protein
MLLRPFVIMLCAAVSCSAVEVQVIANKELSISSLDASDLSDFYLGKRKKLPGGVNATVFTNADRDETERFLDKYLDETPASFSASWKRMIFTGRGIPPTEAKDDQEMIDLIKKTPGGIGYVSVGAAVDGVMVLPVSK